MTEPVTSRTGTSYQIHGYMVQPSFDQNSTPVFMHIMCQMHGPPNASVFENWIMTIHKTRGQHRGNASFLANIMSDDLVSQDDLSVLYSPPETPLDKNSDDEYEDDYEDYPESQDSLSSLNAMMSKWTMASPPPQRQVQIPPCISEDDEEGPAFSHVVDTPDDGLASTPVAKESTNDNSILLVSSSNKQEEDATESKWNQVALQLNQIKSILDLLIPQAQDTVAKQENESLARTNRKLDQLEEQLNRIEKTLERVVFPRNPPHKTDNPTIITSTDHGALAGRPVADHQTNGSNTQEEPTTLIPPVMKVLKLPALWRLKKMRKPELIALCEKHGFETKNLKTKADLLVRLQEETEDK